jgi:rhodanese-related sulfurtransferase
MKIPFLALTLAFTASGTLPLLAQDAPPEVRPSPGKKMNTLNVKIVDVDEAEKLMKDTPGLIVVDVRTPEEYDHQRIKGALNINVFDPEFDQQIAKLDQSKPILVHCAAGGRSKTAVEQMQGKVKFPTVYNMSAGFSAWMKAKKPFEEKPLPAETKPKEKPAKKAEQK